MLTTNQLLSSVKKFCYESYTEFDILTAKGKTYNKKDF